MKKQYKIIHIIIVAVLLQSCASESTETADLIELADIDSAQYYPSNCSSYDNEIVRAFPIELKLDADYKLFFITIEGKEIAMHKQNEDQYRNEFFKFMGDTLCLKYEGIDLSNEKKEKLKITIGLNDITYVYEYKLDFSVDGITYDTLIPLSTWGISKASDENSIALTN